MKLAVSNIAWPAECDTEAFALLATRGIAGVEIAPTRIWPEWQGITPASIREFRAHVESHGLRISSLQSILFQKPGLHLFAADTQPLADHLHRCADIAAELGAGCMVFGSPRNRDRGSLPEADAFAIAAQFFAPVADYCAQRGVWIGFEANPAEYKCNFATDSSTAARLVQAVNSHGFRLHLDTACMHLAGDNAARAIHEHAGILSHVHASEPYLGEFAAPIAAHRETAAALREANYDGWVALEMRAADPPLPALEQAIAFVQETYGDRA